MEETKMSWRCQNIYTNWSMENISDEEEITENLLKNEKIVQYEMHELLQTAGISKDEYEGLQESAEYLRKLNKTPNMSTGNEISGKYLLVIVEHVQGIIGKLLKNAETLTTSVGNVGKDLDTLQNVGKTVAPKLKECRSDVPLKKKKLQPKTEYLQWRAKNLQLDVDNLRAKLKNLQLMKTKLASDSETLQSEFGGVRGIVDDLHDQIDNLQDDIAICHTKTEYLRSEAQNLKLDCTEDILKDISTLQLQQNNLLVKAEKLADKKQVEILQFEVHTLQLADATLQSESEYLMSSSKNMQTNIDNFQTNVKKLRENVKEVELRLKNFQLQSVNLQPNLRYLQTAISKLCWDIEKFQSDIRDLLGVIDKLQYKAENFQEEIEKLQHDAENTLLESNNNNFLAEIKNLTLANKNLQSDIDNIRSDVKTLQLNVKKILILDINAMKLDVKNPDPKFIESFHSFLGYQSDDNNNLSRKVQLLQTTAKRFRQDSVDFKSSIQYLMSINDETFVTIYKKMDKEWKIYCRNHELMLIEFNRINKRIELLRTLDINFDDLLLHKRNISQECTEEILRKNESTFFRANTERNLRSTKKQTESLMKTNNSQIRNVRARIKNAIPDEYIASVTSVLKTVFPVLMLIFMWILLAFAPK